MNLRLIIVVTDPVTGVTQRVERQFDNTQATQAKWTGLFPDVQAATQAVVQSATQITPVTL